MPPKSKVTPTKKRRKRARVSDGGEERSGEEMVGETEESEQKEESEQREESGQREDDSGRMEEEEGETVEGREPEESEDTEYSGARRTGQSGQPPFSDEDEMEMLEFIKAHPVLFAKEHVHYFDKVKDRLWEEIGRRVGRSGQDVKRWFESQRTRYGKLTRDQAKSGSGRKFQRTERTK